MAIAFYVVAVPERDQRLDRVLLRHLAERHHVGGPDRAAHRPADRLLGDLPVLPGPAAVGPRGARARHRDRHRPAAAARRVHRDPPAAGRRGPPRARHPAGVPGRPGAQADEPARVRRAPRSPARCSSRTRRPRPWRWSGRVASWRRPRHAQHGGHGAAESREESASAGRIGRATWRTEDRHRPTRAPPDLRRGPRRRPAGVVPRVTRSLTFCYGDRCARSEPSSRSLARRLSQVPTRRAVLDRASHSPRSGSGPSSPDPPQESTMTVLDHFPRRTADWQPRLHRRHEIVTTGGMAGVLRVGAALTTCGYQVHESSPTSRTASPTARSPAWSRSRADETALFAERLREVPDRHRGRRRGRTARERPGLRSGLAGRGSRAPRRASPRAPRP